jgi:hypothetical protein
LECLDRKADEVCKTAQIVTRRYEGEQQPHGGNIADGEEVSPPALTSNYDSAANGTVCTTNAAATFMGASSRHLRADSLMFTARAAYDVCERTSVAGGHRS